MVFYRSLSSEALDDAAKTRRLIAELIYAGLEIIDPDDVAPYPELDWKDETNTDIFLELKDYDTGNIHQFMVKLDIEKLRVFPDPDFEPYEEEE